VAIVRGLPDDIYHMLHHSFVGILWMRRNIEKDEALINASIAAIQVRGGREVLVKRAVVSFAGFELGVAAGQRT
jgi:hypothetical protein